MCGLASRILCARRTAAELSASGSPAASIISANAPYFYLGALGPALGDFVPHERPSAFGAPGRTPYFALWVRVMEIAVGNAGRGLPGLVPTLDGLKSVLDQVKAAVAAEDVGALTAIRDSGALDRIDELGADLGAILTYFSDLARIAEIGTLMGTASRPAISNPTNLVPEALWTGRDWLTWKGTGDFASRLMQRAGDDRQRAYAIGWQVSFAAQLAISGYVTSAVGSVYRTHWWRHRWVSNYVDAWVWGFYDGDGRPRGAPQAGPFADWRSLCDAGLHRLIDVTGGTWNFEAVARQMAEDQPLPAMLPADFATWWAGVFDEVYGVVSPRLFTADRMQAGYAALGTVLWFQTSGKVVGCNPFPGAPPAACGSGATPPDWIDPTVTNPATGAPFQPPVPEAENDPDVAKIISGIILAILGIVAAVFGGYIIGAVAIAGGIALIVDGAIEPNWDKLRCDLYWLDVYLFNGLEALHRLTVFGGLQPPYARDLDVDELMLSFNGASLPFASGPAVIRSRGIDSLRQPWSGVLSTWGAYASEAIEMPAFKVFSFGSSHWPDVVFDDVTANPMDADIRTPPAAWPGGIRERSFGPAVQNALRILNTPGIDLPNWNLDGDRGLGWLTWKLAAPYAVPVAPVPEP